MGSKRVMLNTDQLEMIPCFMNTATENINDFIKQFREIAQLFRWTKGETFIALRMKLEGEPKDFVRKHRGEFDDIEELLKILEIRYENRGDPFTLLREFMAFAQPVDMPVDKFIDEAIELSKVTFLMNTSSPEIEEENRVNMLIFMLLRNLHIEIRRGVLAKNPKSVSEIRNAAISEENTWNARKTKNSPFLTKSCNVVVDTKPIEVSASNVKEIIERINQNTEISQDVCKIAKVIELKNTVNWEEKASNAMDIGVEKARSERLGNPTPLLDDNEIIDRGTFSTNSNEPQMKEMDFGLSTDQTSKIEDRPPPAIPPRKEYSQGVLDHPPPLPARKQPLTYAPPIPARKNYIELKKTGEISPQTNGTPKFNEIQIPVQPPKEPPVTRKESNYVEKDLGNLHLLEKLETEKFVNHMEAESVNCIQDVTGLNGISTIHVGDCSIEKIVYPESWEKGKIGDRSFKENVEEKLKLRFGSAYKRDFNGFGFYEKKLQSTYGEGHLIVSLGKDALRVCLERTFKLMRFKIGINGLGTKRIWGDYSPD